METFRISKEKFSGALLCSGRENRWNKDGEQLIYSGSSRALSTLEMVVHLNSIKPKEKYKIMVISLPDDESSYEQILIKGLPGNWRSKTMYNELQNIGSNWYNTKRTLVLKVPSAVILNEYNYVINSKHPDFERAIKLVRTEDYFWDDRLFK